MTPKEKAKELVESNCELLNNHIFSGNYDIEKECALKSIEFAREFITGDLTEAFDKTMYLFEIKNEIQKL
jgi:hypothetical protein